eukprot:COSAG01_NODE_28_length_36622_cov_14.695751_30_plen_963_part_00
MAGGDFDPVLEIILFACCLFVAGVLCKRIGVSPVIGEIFVGVGLGPNGADLVPHEQFFRLAGVFGVTLMIFESGLHVDFAMLRKVGAKASLVAVLGTFGPLFAGLGMIMSFDPDMYKLWPVGLSVGVSLAPTSVGMALKMLGEKKQLGEEYGQLIVTAAFVDDILSLVALTMLLQIGLAESTGDTLSIFNVLKPLVLSVVFCVGGALMALPIERTPDDGPVKSVLLRWVGIFPEFVPRIMVWAGHRGHTHHHYAEEMQAEQDHIIEEFGCKLQEAATHILQAIREQNAISAYEPVAKGSSRRDGSLIIKEATINDTAGFIQRDIDHAKDLFHKLAQQRAEMEHHEDVSEEDMERAAVHGKADLFENFLQHTADLIAPLDRTVSKVLKCMAVAHNIIHETKEGEHREQWEQEIEAKIERHMMVWRRMHSASPTAGHGGDDEPHLGEIKEEAKYRTKLVLNRAMKQVSAAFLALKPRGRGSEFEDERQNLMEKILSSKAEDKKKAGLLKLKVAVEHATSELEVITALSVIRADIWDDWMGEVIIDVVSQGRSSPGVIRSLEELQYLQTHLFEEKEKDILGEIQLGFHARDSDVKRDDDRPPQSPLRLSTATTSFGASPMPPASPSNRGQATSTGESEEEEELESDEDEEEDPLFVTRMKWRAELHEEHAKENRFILTMMFALLIGYGFVANEIGSHLLGAFIAGMSFCWMDPALMLWHSQVKRIANWLIRLFFGATVAFSIPIQIMMDGEALWKGALLGIGPCILTKIVSGVFAGDDKWVVGFAMVGRGEFAYLVAQTAQDTLLNPAPSSFDNPRVHFVKMSGGYWCVNGDCGNSTVSAAGGRRHLAGDDGCDSGGTSEQRWCAHCVGGGCHDVPMPGHHYWKVGEECGENPTTCDCEMMMPADAFAITVWALVLASVLAPIGFGFMLKLRIKAKAQLKAEAKAARSVARLKAPAAKLEASTAP